MPKLIYVIIGLSLIMLHFSALPMEGLAIGLIYSKSQCESFKKSGAEHVDKLLTYTQAVTKFGNRIVPVCPDLTVVKLQETISQLDALIIPGGDDIAPNFYHESPIKELEIIDEDFDQFEFKVFKLARDHKIPIFGICRGLQLINVALGGSLYQDIPTQVKTKEHVVHRSKKDGKSQPTYHELTLTSNGSMASFLNTNKLLVNTYHHQAIKKLAGNLTSLARTNDDLVEAFESTDSPYILATQFHPEKELATDPNMEKIFEYFWGRAAKRHGDK
jgi:gamma-glutamyl-gamma-aminobutyrate hydrolase PuuD